MIKHSVTFLTMIFWIVSCSPKDDYPKNRYFDYSGLDGCSPPNIGHMLGGDLEGIGDNSLDGMRHIVSMQELKCFKHWEFDVTPTVNDLVLRHNFFYGMNLVSGLSRGGLPSGTPTLNEFLFEFNQLEVTKSLMIDLKMVTAEGDFIRLKNVAIKIREKHKIDVWFITDQISAFKMNKVCEVMNGEFDVMLYLHAGKLCP